MSGQLGLPEGKRFAFTVFDDTEYATAANTRALYDFLTELGLRTTKSVWVYPPRGANRGSSLEDDDYREVVLELQRRGFEIAFHNVGGGDFTREEILAGLAEYEEILGAGPRVHANHLTNPDNLYHWDERFEWPVNLMYRAAYRLLNQRPTRSRGSGSDPDGPRFWGDAALERRLYVRNLVFNDINTLKRDPRMPYHVNRKRWVHRWFSSSDGHNCRIFSDMIAPDNVDRLEREGGVCIAYTHFSSGFVDKAGVVDPTFRERMSYLASKETGWFVPVSVLLDHLAARHEGDDPGWPYRMGRNIRWLADRLDKRRRYRL